MSDDQIPAHALKAEREGKILSQDGCTCYKGLGSAPSGCMTTTWVDTPYGPRGIQRSCKSDSTDAELSPIQAAQARADAAQAELSRAGAPRGSLTRREDAFTSTPRARAKNLDAAQGRFDAEQAELSKAGAPPGSKTRDSIGTTMKVGGNLVRARWQQIPDDAPRVPGEEKRTVTINGVMMAKRFIAVPE